MDPHVYGHGPIRALFIHGWFGDAMDFDSMLVAAVDQERFSIARLEIRGYGEARHSGGPYNMDTIARDALDLADKLGWKRFALIGHSMGGKAALRVAELAPERVERLCGVAPVWAGPTPFDADTLAFFRSARDAVEARRGIIDLTTGGRLPSYWSGQVAEQSLAISEREAFGDYFESWALDDLSQGAKGLDVETRVIVGAHDAAISEAVARATWLVALPNASLTVLPDCGHYPANESPLILAAVISDFLEGEGKPLS